MVNKDCELIQVSALRQVLLDDIFKDFAETRKRWLVAVLRPPDCSGQSLALAETAAASDAAAGSAGAAVDFRAVWQPRSCAQTARNTTGMAERQAQNAKTPLQSGQKQPAAA